MKFEVKIFVELSINGATIRTKGVPFTFFDFSMFNVTSQKNKLHHVNIRFTEEDRVPDVCRYKVINKKHSEWKVEEIGDAFFFNNGSKKFKTDLVFEEFNKLPKKATKNIVLILESPHRDEYSRVKSTDGSLKLTPIGPAQRITGDNIKSLIERVFSLIDGMEDCEYNLWICNPIPFQTSLGHSYKGKLIENIRNNIWRGLWADKLIQNDFIDRLQKYEPSIIINACTEKMGNEIDVFLKEEALNRLAPHVPDIIYQRIKHPSGWKTVENFEFRHKKSGAQNYKKK